MERLETLQPQTTLGGLLLKVEDIMDKRYPTLTPDTTLKNAAKLLAKKNVSGAPVLDAKGLVIGLLSARECFMRLLEAPHRSLDQALVEDYMRIKVFSVEPDIALSELMELFCRQWFHVFSRMPRTKAMWCRHKSDGAKSISGTIGVA